MTQVEDVKPEYKMFGYVVMEFDFVEAGPDERDQFLCAQVALHFRAVADWPLHRFKDKVQGYSVNDILLVNIGAHERKRYPVLGRATHFTIDLSMFTFTFLREIENASDCQG